MSKIWAILFISILIAGCGALNAARNINPVQDENVTILKRTKGAAMEKNNITVIVVPLQDVKELDGFGIMIVNKTPNWISIRKEECMLVQDGKVIYPIEHEKAMARLGAGYKPKMPNELNADIYEWKKEINTMKSRTNTKVVDEDKKISIITGSKDTIYLYFNTQGNTSPMQIIIPNIFNEATKEKTSFSFRFEVTKK